MDNQSSIHKNKKATPLLQTDKKKTKQTKKQACNPNGKK
jgi:hypothetical protein